MTTFPKSKLNFSTNKKYHCTCSRCIFSRLHDGGDAAAQKIREKQIENELQYKLKMQKMTEWEKWSPYCTVKPYHPIAIAGAYSKSNLPYNWTRYKIYSTKDL